MARRNKRGGWRVAVVMLGLGLAGGWWLAQHGLPKVNWPKTSSAPPAPKPAGDIHRVDFQNFSYTPDCVMVDGEPGGTVLPVRNGSYRLEQEDNHIIFGVLSVRYGDLDGDGRDEAAVVTHCNLGGSGQFTEGMVFAMRSGQPVLIGRVEGGDRAYGGIESLSIEDGRLLVGRFATDDGPACCPEYIETTAMRWDGKRLVQDGASTRRPAPVE
jgi:hypothetical protein